MTGILIAGNWKMHGTPKMWQLLAHDIAEGAVYGMDETQGIEYLICPPFLGVPQVGGLLKEMHSCVRLGAQDVHPMVEGAYTGDISAAMLKETGVSYVIVGHSERRTAYGETNRLVAEKAAHAVKTGLIPIVCIGESANTREEGDVEGFIRSQLEASLEGVKPSEGHGLVIAYEPVWAIGSGKAAGSREISDVMQTIRRVCVDKYGEIGQKVRVLYGGSVKPETVEDLMNTPEIGGFLIGGAALNAETFLNIGALAAKHVLQHAQDR